MTHIFYALLGTVLTTAASSAFLFPKPISINTGLVQVVDAQETKVLNIKLDIGNFPDTYLSIRDMVVALSSAENDRSHPKMPGAQGPHPQLSSGVRSLDVMEDGYFIGMNGKVMVKALNGCWEMVWREHNAFGSLIFGFEIPEEYVRNHAILPKGRLYLSFPVWTKIGLLEAQDMKQRTLARSKDLIADKVKEFEKMEATSNPFKKALHFRNALTAVEKHSFIDVSGLASIPTNDGIIYLQDDLLLSKTGMAFSKDRIYFQSKHDLLGTASASLVGSQKL
jgi:hypothetical protein